MKEQKKVFDGAEIVVRLEAGESHAQLAEQLGLTLGQFRYRMQKYMKMQKETRAETAAARTEQEQDILLDPTLADESWTRAWQVNRLVLLVKEPTSLFAYWELTDLRKRLICEHFQCGFAELPLFLHVYDVTQIQFNGYNAASTRRIQVHPHAETYYLNDVQPGRRYMVDYGTTTLAGNFFTFLRSNIVETPAKPAGRNYEPKVRFGSLHQAGFPQVNLKPGLQTPQADSSAAGEHWRDQFDGYSIAWREGGER